MIYQHLSNDLRGLYISMSFVEIVFPHPKMKKGTATRSSNNNFHYCKNPVEKIVFLKFMHEISLKQPRFKT